MKAYGGQPRRRGWLGLVLCLIAVVALGGRGVVADEVVARGRGVVVRSEEVEQLLVEQKTMLRRRGEAVTREQEIRMEEQILEQLIARRVLGLRATEEDRKRARELVEQGVAEHKARVGSLEAYRRELLVAGTTPEVVEARLVEQVTADQVVLRELKSQVQVTDEQVTAFYERGDDLQSAEVRQVADRLTAAHQDTAFYRDATNRLETIRRANLARLEKPAEARARVLVLFTVDPATGKSLSEAVRRDKQERIEKLRTQALSGEDFARLAREHSEEPEASKNNGEFVARLNQIPTELRKPLFEGPTNQVSEVITTAMGYYLVQVLDRTEGGKVPIAEARESIRDLLANQEVGRRLPKWVEALKKEYEVELVGK